MAVEVLEAAAIHQAIVLRRAGVDLAARRACSLDGRIDRRAAIALDRQSSASTEERASMIVLEVKSAKCSGLRSMKTIVSDHFIAAALPGREKRWSLVKPTAS
jgi:hypothetical protein